MSIANEQEKYEKWWLGKMCRVRNAKVFSKVIKVTLNGPPSFVYGNVYLDFEDGRKDVFVYCLTNKPTRKDVEIRSE